MDLCPRYYWKVIPFYLPPSHPSIHPCTYSIKTKHHNCHAAYVHVGVCSHILCGGLQPQQQHQGNSWERWQPESWGCWWEGGGPSSPLPSVQTDWLSGKDPRPTLPRAPARATPSGHRLRERGRDVVNYTVMPPASSRWQLLLMGTSTSSVHRGVIDPCRGCCCVQGVVCETCGLIY